MRSIVTLVFLLLLRIVGIQASYYGIDYHAKAAYFNYDNAKRQSLYVWSLNVVDNGDVYFHMSGPVSHCWIGVGFGSEMKDSFMLIAYPSANGRNTTISARKGIGHTEPVYDPSVEILKIYNDTYAPNANTVSDNGTGAIIAHAVCKNCASWMSLNGPRSLDVNSTAQPFIFAIGPNITFREDSPAASLPRHGFVGRFNMQMTHATNYSGWYGRVPAPNVPDFVFPPNDTDFASYASTTAFDTIQMDNPLPGVHAALMLTAFVLLFPVGGLVMQFLKKVLWHAAIEVVGFGLVFGGFGVAFKFSGQYVKSKNYDSYHQIIGFIVLAGLVIQLGLGLIHHAFYMKSKNPTPFGRVHFFLGPFIIILGMINGGLGIHFAGNYTLVLPYAVVTAIIGFVFVAAISCFFCLSRRKKYKPDLDEKEDIAKGSDSEYEMSQASGYGEHPPEPYMPPTPFSPTSAEMVPAPYFPTVPYSPLSALPPGMHSTWTRDDMAYSHPHSYGL